MSVYVHIHAVVPHVTDAIQEWVERVSQIPVAGDQKRPDICVIEVREMSVDSERKRVFGGEGACVHLIFFYFCPAWWYHW